MTTERLRQLHPSRERRQAVIAFGAVEYGCRHLPALPPGWRAEGTADRQGIRARTVRMLSPLGGR